MNLIRALVLAVAALGISGTNALADDNSDYSAVCNFGWGPILFEDKNFRGPFLVVSRYNAGCGRKSKPMHTSAG